MRAILRVTLFVSLLQLALSPIAFGESQKEPYRSVTDPFGDPSSYEFAEDEKADKEFFHLGRFLMFGFSVGAGIYTGGLGKTINPGAYFGGRVIYFFDRALAFEASAHFSNSLDQIRTTTIEADIDTNIIPLNLGFRYYFDVKEAPKAVALANPYLAFGGGAYLRQQTVVFAQPTFNVSNANNSQFGAYGAAGIEFDIYRRHLYLGLDLRFHFIFFFDEDDNLGGNVNPGDRAGDYFTPSLTITYSF